MSLTLIYDIILYRLSLDFGHQNKFWYLQNIGINMRNHSQGHFVVRKAIKIMNFYFPPIF